MHYYKIQMQKNKNSQIQSHSETFKYIFNSSSCTQLKKFTESRDLKEHKGGQLAFEIT